ncbi:MAG TPA: SDR family oxidoreductase [Abditibacteriaceae bacterium]|jgi:NAD(P)-dependent dehydrogenase (short-subunit alcohol dehydrogenase family)
MFSLQGKRVIVTGGASGIGRAIAERFTQAGARVLIADITDATELAASLGARFQHCDVSQESDLVEMMGAARDAFGGVDVLISNAAIQPLGASLERTTTALLERTFAVNVASVAMGLKHAARFLERGGAVLNTASFVGVLAAPGIGVYGVSKAAVVHLTKIGAIELAPYGLRVNCVCPGTIATPAVTDLPDNPEIGFVEETTLAKRLGRPEEIAAAFHYLASDEAAYITGHALSIDGGLTAGLTHYDLPPLSDAEL